MSNIWPYFSFLSYEWFWVGSFLKNSLLDIKELPEDVICDITIYADDTPLCYSKCDQESDPWQQLELASELESDL